MSENSFFSFFDSVVDIANKVSMYIETQGVDSDLDFEMYLAGGAAVNFYVSSRTSDDVDAIFSHRVVLNDELFSFYRDGEVLRKVVFDSNYNDTLLVMHPDYKQDSKIVKNIGILKLKALNPEDLVISKLSRFAESDERDIQLLIDAGLVDIELLEKRFKEACKYYIFPKNEIESAFREVREYYDDKQDETQRTTDLRV